MTFDEEDEDNSIDPELANEKFSALRKQYTNTSNMIKIKNRKHKDALLEIYNLSEIFKQFRLVPKQFDHLVNNMRDMMERVRTQERIIMRLCIEECQMPRKNFIKIFSGNETNINWLIKEPGKQ